MAEGVSVLFEGLTIVATLELVKAADLLKPNTLVVVNSDLIPAVFEEQGNGFFSLRDQASFHLIASSDRIQCSIRSV
jgi:hypothetical protein